MYSGIHYFSCVSKQIIMFYLSTKYVVFNNEKEYNSIIVIEY